MNVCEDSFRGQLALPLKISETEKGNFSVTSSFLPGKVWVGASEEAAIRAARSGIEVLNGKRELLPEPAWMTAERQSQADRSGKAK